MGFYEKKGLIAIVDMGSVARSLEEFLEIQTRIDYESIEHQFSGDVNDFCEWIVDSYFRRWKVVRGDEADKA